MKAKYFTAENREAAEDAAANYFGCAKEEVIFEIIGKYEETERCHLIAMIGAPVEIANMDAHYSVFYESDGVYLELYKKRGAGQALVVNELMTHLSRKNINELNTLEVQALLDITAGRTKIAAAQEEFIYGESLIIVIIDDEQKAEAILLAPEEGGELLDITAARRQLHDAGVTHGIDEEVFSRFIETKDYRNSCIVAKATPPVDGEDGKLQFNFSTDERTGSPKEIG